MTTIKYKLHVRAKGADGSLRPFDLVIFQPEPHPEFGWQCLVHCEALRGKPMRVYGDEVWFAWAMAVDLVARLLDYAEWSLVDEEGNTINLPKIENEE